MARNTYAPRVLVATIADAPSAKRAACTIETSAYRQEIEEFFDARENRELRTMMQRNRAPFLS